MLHKYSFSNFQSFLERVEVDLTLNDKTQLTDWMAFERTGEKVSKLMAVIGPNASGKTALLKPLVFIAWFIGQSFQKLSPGDGIPVTPHASSAREPSEFEIQFGFDGKLWKYALRCTPERVLLEALYLKRERFGYVFVRKWNEANEQYQIKLHKDFGFALTEAKKVRPNASLIATAAQYGVSLAQQLTTPFVTTNVNVYGRLPMRNGALFTAAEYFSSRPALQTRMRELLTQWDLGLINVKLEQIPASTSDDLNRKIWMPYGHHERRSAKFSLPFPMESSGTQSAFILLSRLLGAIEMGGVAVIDEFESDLHPHMLEPILELFADKKTNPHNAQLLFTCHAVEVLNILHKSQAMLVQKNQDCESTAYRLDDVEGIRNDDNFYAKYMAGAYGAVPEF